jgi:hypothetical protein
MIFQCTSRSEKGSFSVRFQTPSQNCEEQLLASSWLSVCPSFCLSLCPHRTTRLPPDGLSWNLKLTFCFENLSRKFKFRLTPDEKSVKTNVYHVYHVCSFLLRMRNLSKLKRMSKHTLHSTFFFFINRAVYEIMWENIVEPDRAQMTIWRMRIECCTQTHTQNV